MDQFMKIEPIIARVSYYQKTPLRCFIWGCRKEAEHLMQFAYGGVKVQAFLCGYCLKKSPEFIKKLHALCDIYFGIPMIAIKIEDTLIDRPKD